MISANRSLCDVLEGRARWTVLHADNADVLPLLPDRSVDHVITDPPYEAEAHSKQRRLKSKAAPDSVDGDKGRGVVFAPLPFAAITATEREGAGRVFVRIASRWILTFCQVEAAHKWRAVVEAVGGRYRRTGIWVKPDGQPQLNGLEPGQGYESICICHSRAAMRWNGGGRHGVFTHPTGPNSLLRAGHPTEKPIALMLELVELFTDPGELILDPFCGSGTTGVACLRLGRRFIGIEKDEKYAAVARERLTAEGQGLSLRDARAGQMSLLAEKEASHG